MIELDVEQQVPKPYKVKLWLEKGVGDMVLLLGDNKEGTISIIAMFHKSGRAEYIDNSLTPWMKK